MLAGLASGALAWKRGNGCEVTPAARPSHPDASGGCLEAGTHTAVYTQLAIVRKTSCSWTCSVRTSARLCKFVSTAVNPVIGNRTVNRDLLCTTVYAYTGLRDGNAWDNRGGGVCMLILLCVDCHKAYGTCFIPVFQLTMFTPVQAAQPQAALLASAKQHLTQNTKASCCLMSACSA